MDVGTSAAVIAGITTLGRPATELVREFVTKIFGPAADAIGHSIASPFEELNRRRAQRAAALIEGAAHALEAQGRSARTVPDDLLLPILERSSLVDDEDLRAIWTQLLATAANPDATYDVLPSFPQILSELTGREARLLEFIYFEWNRRDSASYADLKRRYDASIEDYALYVMLENLARLKLIDLYPQIQSRQIADAVAAIERHGHDAQTEVSIEPGFNDSIFATALGDTFVNACTGPR